MRAKNLVASLYSKGGNVLFKLKALTRIRVKGFGQKTVPEIIN